MLELGDVGGEISGAVCTFADRLDEAPARRRRGPSRLRAQHGAPCNSSIMR